MSNHPMPIPSEQLANFCQRWQVRQLALFGSTVRGEARPDSDVDVLVELEPNHTLDLFDWVDMIDELREIFGRDVDLVSKGGLRNPIRRRRILDSARVVYG